MPERTAMTNLYGPMLSMLRIVAGLVYLSHGTGKLLGFPFNAAAVGMHPFTLEWFSGLVELVGGLLLVLGLFTRTAALLTSGEMAVGYFMIHAPRSLFPTQNGGDAAILYCWIFLFLVVAGGGSWSLDRLLFSHGRPSLLAAE